jgi:hypothetical protein
VKIIERDNHCVMKVRPGSIYLRLDGVAQTRRIRVILDFAIWACIASLLAATVFGWLPLEMSIVSGLGILFLLVYVIQIVRNQEVILQSHGKTLNELTSKVDQLTEWVQLRDLASGFRRRFLIKQGQRWASVETSKIVWFTADDKICFARTRDNRRLVVDYTLEELSAMLDPEEFYRVNRSFIVNRSVVSSVSSYFGGKLLIHTEPVVGGAEIIVSKEKATEVKRWLGK